jgi:hypothetical protein
MAQTEVAELELPVVGTPGIVTHEKNILRFDILVPSAGFN